MFCTLLSAGNQVCLSLAQVISTASVFTSSLATTLVVGFFTELVCS